LSTVPKGWGYCAGIPLNGTGNCTKAAEVRVTASGATLFASNRGHNSIVAFAIRDKGASLALIGWPAMGVVWPRGFDLTPDSSVLIATSNSQPGLAEAPLSSSGHDDWEGDVVVYAVDERGEESSMLTEVARLNAAHPCDVHVQPITAVKDKPMPLPLRVDPLRTTTSMALPATHLTTSNGAPHTERHLLPSTVPAPSRVYMNEIGWQAHSYNDMRAWPAMFRKGTDHLKIDINWQRGWLCQKQKRLANPDDARGCFVLNHDDPTALAFRTDYNTTDDLISVLHARRATIAAQLPH
jgi:hypothetical protein